MKYFLFSFFLLFTVFTKAQTVWNNIHQADRPTMLFSSIVKVGSAYKVIGVTSPTQPPYLAKALWTSFDDLGQIYNWQSAPDTVYAELCPFWNNLIVTNNGQLAFGGYGDDTTGLYACFFLWDANTDTLSVFRYSSDAYSFFVYDLLQYDDSTFYLTGVYNKNPGHNANVFLMKVDSRGNRIWEKYYDQLDIDIANSIIKLDPWNLLLGCTRIDLDGSSDIELPNTWLLQVDTGGNLVRQWFDPNDSTYAAEGLLQTQDGGFIYGAQKKNYQSGSSLVSYNATIVKMDYSFNKQWTFTRGGNDLSIYTGINDIEELPDGNFIAAGNLAHYGADSALNGYIIKLDTGGHVIWEKTYRGINATLNFLTDIDVLPDGSLIAVGQCKYPNHTPPQVGWFLKLDSNGCEIENCVLGINEESLNSNLQMQAFPNPFTTTLSISLQKENLQQADFTITNIIGQPVYTKHESNLSSTYTKTLDLSYLPAGVYFLEVIAGGERSVRQLVKQ